MKAEWKIQLNTKVYGCYQQQLTLDEKNHTRLATIDEQKDFLNDLMTIELDELQDAYLIERVDIFREHLKALNYNIEFFHAWNEVSANSYTEYTKIQHQEINEIVACYKVITTQSLSETNEIIDVVGALEKIELTKYEVAKDSKIGSIKLQLLDMGITE
ncbi:MAG: hypothetical protein IJD87_00395, partial [Turicibacter sp.]|nr:hypothetical protein [Turicibacter sp.]